jgi:Tol biopolymer transport system component
MSEISWVPATEGFSDYRPVFSPDGGSLLYEHTGEGKTVFSLYKLGAETPKLFIASPPADLPAQTRADWAADGTVSFTGDVSGYDGYIWLCDASGKSVKRLPLTYGMCYSAWYAGSEWMVVMNTNGGQPFTCVIGRSGATVLPRRSPIDLFAGMPSISQQNPERLAIPASPARVPYNQQNNQIYVSLDPASAITIDDSPKQGRAPWWSPDGQYLAFESDRSGTGYAVYVAKIGKNGAASRIVQLTNPNEVFNAQHPKFSPDGKTICFCAQRTMGALNSVGTMPFTQF